MPSRDVGGEGSQALVSAAVEDFVGVAPAWLIRRGNAALLVVFVALVIGAWMLEYPDVVAAPVTITTESPPAPVVARTSGQVRELWVTDGDEVVRDQWLAVIDNSAATADVRVLAAMLAAFAETLDDPAAFDASRHRLGDDLDLGELEVAYMAFVAAWRDLRATVDDPYFEASGSRIAVQLETSAELLGSLQRQARGLVADLAQAERDADSAAALVDEGALAAREAELARAEVRQRRREIESAGVDVLGRELDRAALDRARIELEYERRERHRERLRAVRDAYAALSQAYEGWRRDYLLVAPMTGRVSLDRIWSRQQWVAVDDEVMTIIPSLDEIVARVELGQLNSGKVEVGQRALIKLDGYPHREYGVVEGEVASVPAIAREGIYLVTVRLPAGLETSHHRQLELRHDMRGTAEIVTAERRLLERLFLQIRSLIDQS